MKRLDALLDVFRLHGLRITPQRRVILALLVDNDSHPTAEEVYQRALAAMPDISRTTVYNTLRELSDLGELSPVRDLSEGGQRYDTKTEPHHHLYCVECHALIDIDHSFEDLDLAPLEKAGYRILGHRLTFFGVCPDCRAAKRGAPISEAAHGT